MTQCCKNCQFLMKEAEQLPLRSWTKEDREENFPRMRVHPGKLKQPDGSWDRASVYTMRIGCFRGIWEEEHNEHYSDNSWGREVMRNRLTKDMTGSCFFVDFQEGMTMEGAKELHNQQREDQYNSQLIHQHNRRFRLALITAIVAIVFSAASLGWQVYAFLTRGQSYIW